MWTHSQKPHTFFYICQNFSLKTEVNISKFCYEKLCFQGPQPVVGSLPPRPSRKVVFKDGDSAPFLPWSCNWVLPKLSKPYLPYLDDSTNIYPALLDLVPPQTLGLYQGTKEASADQGETTNGSTCKDMSTWGGLGEKKSYMKGLAARVGPKVSFREVY